MAAPGESSASHLLSTRGMQRVASSKIEMFILKDFLSDEECRALIERIDASRRPSTVADSNGDTSFRTSETCDLPHADPVVAALDAKLAAVSGIDHSHAEPLQGQCYEVGQEFKAHTDCFTPGTPDWDRYCTVSASARGLS